MNVALNSASAKCLYIAENERRNKFPVPGDAEAAVIGREITFDTSVLDTFNVQGFLPVHLDLLILCAAIEFADRRWKRPRGWKRQLHVTLPVNDTDAWHDLCVQGCLRSVLNHLTCDEWEFTFVKAKDTWSIDGRQRPLFFPDSKTFAIAYSDGLDSRAVTALSGDPDEALCVRITKSNHYNIHGDHTFTRIPFKVLVHRNGESSFLSRGFKFAAVTAIAAQLSTIDRIVVPESGQSALGSPLLPLHNIYPDYRNHPTFFRNMEQFIKKLLNYHGNFIQPRLWSTKGQTMQAFLNLPGKCEQELIRTRSCWQSRRIVNNEGTRKQCGLCAACLLRRQSLHAAAITEPPDTYVVSDLHLSTLAAEALSKISNESDRKLMTDYGRDATGHLQNLADLTALTDKELYTHASIIAESTGESHHGTLKRLKTLLVGHADEWHAFLAEQGSRSFLKNWILGEHHV